MPLTVLKRSGRNSAEVAGTRGGTTGVELLPRVYKTDYCTAITSYPLIVQLLPLIVRLLPPSFLDLPCSGVGGTHSQAVCDVIVFISVAPPRSFRPSVTESYASSSSPTSQDMSLTKLMSEFRQYVLRCMLCIIVAPRLLLLLTTQASELGPTADVLAQEVW